MSAGRKIAALQRAEIPELSRFLISGFGVPATADCFSHEVLAWKYFDGPAGPTETSNCSFVARVSGQIIGHIGICPRQFIISGNDSIPVSTMHAIDWLGSPEHPGCGAFLMLHAFGTCETQYAVGGSDLAQAVFPRLGFEPRPAIAVFRKLLAPFHRLRTSNQGFFRKWAGTARDLSIAWSTRTPRPLVTVELRQVTQFTDEIDGLLRQSSLQMVACQRDHSLLNYFLRYPVPGLTGWTIHIPGRMTGFALLNVTQEGQIRSGKIVDCWLETDDSACWQSAVAALVERLRDQSADSVTCYATTPGLYGALEWNGFSHWCQKNVFVRDRKPVLPQDIPLGLSMLEADHAIF